MKSQYQTLEASSVMSKSANKLSSCLLIAMMEKQDLLCTYGGLVGNLVVNDMLDKQHACMTKIMMELLRLESLTFVLLL